VPQGSRVVRLDVTLMNGRGVELTLDDDGGLSESLLDIALLELDVLGDVAMLAGWLAERLGDEIVVEQRRVVPHGGTDIGDVRQWLVLDGNQLQGFFREVSAD